MVQNRLKKILCLILFLSLISPVFATDLNWSLTGTASGTGSTTGTVAEVKDNNTATYNGAGCVSWGADSDTFSYSVEVAFSESVGTINKAEIYHNPYGTCAGPGGAFSGTWYVDLYYSSAWHNVITGTWDSSPSGTGLQTSSSSTGWSDVTKIRLRADGGSASSDRPWTSVHETYELRAWGPPNYSDIGLRIYDGSSVIKIGVQALDGHALRVRKGDTIYGIPLLATDSADASSLRIFDGSSVKALPEVD